MNATSRRTLITHAAALIAVDALGSAQFVMLPFIALRVFDAGDWQTMMITAAPPTLMVAAIFWNRLLEHVSLRPFLAVFAAVGLLPTALISLSGNYWTLFALHAIACIGVAGWPPVKGELLRRFYPALVRGRALGLINAAVLLAGLGIGLALGYWLERDGTAFRIYLPAFFVVQAAGLVVIARLVGRAPASAETPAGTTPVERPERRTGMWGPLRNLRTRLREDRRFRLYEAAFMTYGAGWMICEALRPILLDKHLRMSYQEIAITTHAVFNLSLVAMSFQAGRIMDRLGAMRTSALAFTILALYPLGLLISQSSWHIGATMLIYGIAMAGVQQGWMLGPVSLAPRPELVAEYVAIHTTLVGLRGLFAQVLAMVIYRLGGAFIWPLLLAAAFFLWGAWQMWTLHRGDQPGQGMPNIASSRARS